MLKTARITTFGNGVSKVATVLFDEGADRSFITTRFANSINANANFSETLNLKSFSNPKTGFKTVPRTTVGLLQTNGIKSAIDLLVVDEISDNLDNYLTHDLRNISHIRNLKLAHPLSHNTNMTVDVLIGADHYWDYVGSHIIRGCSPVAVSSAFGYLLSGPIHSTQRRGEYVQTFHIATVKTPDTELDNLITSFWDLEAVGVHDTIKSSELKVAQNEQYTQYIDHCLTTEDGRYTAKLPWKPDHPTLPTNYQAANTRTRNMIAKLPNELVKVYNNILNDQMNKGFIEKVTDDTPDIGHYLPHLSVKKDSESTPIRIVYDCSATTGKNQPSLNQYLDTGPPLLNSLTSILLRFRANPIALTADIEKAFLQIRLHETDRKYTKFLWLTDSTDINSPFETFQFKSVLFGATCSPFILNAAIKHLTNEHISKPTAQILQQDIYVDDVISSCATSMEAIRFYEQAIDILSTRKFNLRSWNTNDPFLRQITDIDGRSNSKSDVPVLGIGWDSKTDILRVKPLKAPNFGQFTSKRDVVAYSASLYDPLGMLSPVHIKAKLIIQRLWITNHNWDTPIDSELLQLWQNTADDLYKLTDNQIARKYFVNNPTTVEIHAFCDASEKAYGAAVYLVSDTESTLVMAKARVAPINKQALTLPRLELMGAVIGTRLNQFVGKSLEQKYSISKYVLWSDSQITLHWLHGRGKQNVFTRNRVTEINAFKQELHYINTAENPADLVTRGITPAELTESKLWWNGPSWLTNQNQWPKCELFDAPTTIESDQRIKTEDTSESTQTPASSPTEVSEQTVLHAVVTTMPEHAQLDPPFKSPTTRGQPISYSETPTAVNYNIDNVFQINQYRNISHLLRVTALVLRFITKLRERTKKPALFSRLTSPDDNCQSTTPSSTEIELAELVWIRNIQHLYYDDQIQSLIKNNGKLGDLCKQLKLFVDDDQLLRAGGRLQNTNLPYNTVHPLLIPGKHAFTSMIIRDTHLRLQHAGTNAITSKLRERYWITSMRRFVKAVLHQCVVCKKVDGTPYSKPIPAPLPTFRVQQSEPFSTIGIDYTGHLFVKDPITQTIVKVYICLFTCTTTRAIHLELVSDLTTDRFY